MADPTPEQEAHPPIAFGSTITILFSDIRGFTDYTDEFGDAAAYRMLQHHNALIEEQIALYGGHIVKRLGDSFMVSFEAARTAVACGIAVQRALDQHNRSQQGTRIEVGVGINTGEPVRDAEDLFGSSVNLASRICAAAGPSEVLVSEAVRHVVGRMEGAGWTDRGYFELKGFQEPQHLFEVGWSADRAAETPHEPASTHERLPAAGKPSPAIKRSPASSQTQPRKTAAPWLIAAAAAFVAVGAAAGFLLIGGGGRAAVEGTPVEGSVTSPPGWRLLRADDFSNPAAGLFFEDQGTTRGTTSSGIAVSAPWESRYEGRGLAIRVKGPYTANPDNWSYGPNPAASGRIQEEFAVEVRARVAKSPLAAEYGLMYDLPRADDWYNWVVTPETGEYRFVWAGSGNNTKLLEDRSNLLRRGREETLLRMEVSGDTARLLANGEELAKVRHEGLTRRDVTVRLIARITAPPEDVDVEVRYTDFKVFVPQQ